MMKTCRGRRGQVVSAEMAAGFVVVMAAAVMMTVYVQRALQGRARDAQVKAVSDAETALGVRVPAQYEPYYAKTSSETDQFQKSEEWHGGLYNKLSETERAMQIDSTQFPPKDAR